MEMVSQVDEYVFGYAEGKQGCQDFAEWEEKLGDYMAPVSSYLQRELDQGDFPHVEEFMDGEDFHTGVRRMISEYAGRRASTAAWNGCWTASRPRSTGRRARP